MRSKKYGELCLLANFVFHLPTNGDGLEQRNEGRKIIRRYIKDLSPLPNQLGDIHFCLHLEEHTMISLC